MTEEFVYVARDGHILRTRGDYGPWYVRPCVAPTILWPLWDEEPVKWAGFEKREYHRLLRVVPERTSQLTDGMLLLWVDRILREREFFAPGYDLRVERE
jgi:hypothetical protein